MSFVFTDDFNRTGGTLGNGWTEHAIGANPVSNFRTDGSYAGVEGSTNFHVATAPMLAIAPQHVQCWINTPSGNNAGVVFRFQNTDNFYYAVAVPGTGVVVVRRKAAVTTVLATVGPAGLISASTWQRLMIRMIGNVIQLYVDNLYQVAGALNGPLLNLDDTAGPGGGAITGTGIAGIASSGNTAGGLPNLKWNDFAVFDGTGTVLYVDTGFNGGSPGEGMGSESRPDITIQHALNSPGCEAGSTVRIASSVDIGNTGIPTSPVFYSIGHQGRYGNASYSFPTYNPDNGRVLDAGNPNLIIESDTGNRCTLVQTDQPGVGRAFFRIRSTATGIVIRGFDFELPSANSCLLFLTDDAPNDHSVHVAKCSAVNTDPLVSLAHWLFANSANTVRVETHYCYFKCGQGTHGPFIDLDRRVQRFISDFCIFQGKETASVGQMSEAIGSGTNCDPQAGDTWRLNHNTFINIFRNLFNDGAFSVLDNTNFRATTTFRNNIIRGSDIAADTSFGVYTNTGTLGAPGVILCNNNGYFQVDTPRDVGATNNGAEITTDPVFTDPAKPFIWQHTQGHGLNGEAAFLPMTLDGDFRPTNDDYLDSSDDASELLGILDRGALQGFALPAEEGAGSEVPPIILERYCVTVIFDPGGEQETDLSNALLEARPIRSEKDVLLRRYKANDAELKFADPDSMFVETNPASFLRLNGRPDWYGKRVEIQASIGNTILVRFVGFLLDVGAERGTGYFTIANRFQALAERTVRANTLGKLVSTLRFPGIGPVLDSTDPNAPADGIFVGTIGGRVAPGNLGLNGPPAQTYTMNWISDGLAADFTVTGSVTGFEGSGKLRTTGSWTSATGHLTLITPPIGGDIFDPAAGPNTGETSTFEVLWRPTQGQGIIAAIRQFLLDPLGAGLTLADLDFSSFADLEGTLNDQTLPNIGAPVVPRLAATEGNVLDALASFALHAGCALFETSDARIGLSSFMPRIIPDVPTLCKTDDLVAAAVGHLEIYNEFQVLRTFDERNQQFTAGETWPAQAENDSQARYGRRLPAPSALAFRGYDGSNEPWTKTVAQVLYERHKDPRAIYSIRSKIENLDAELDDVYRLDSEAPNIQVDFTDPTSLEKSITGDLTVDMQVISTEVVTDGACPGFLDLDNPLKGLDDPCWGLF